MTDFNLDRAGADVRSAAASQGDAPTIDSLHGRNRRRQRRRRAVAAAILAVPVLVLSVAVAVAVGGGSDSHVVAPAGPGPAAPGASSSPEPPLAPPPLASTAPGPPPSTPTTSPSTSQPTSTSRPPSTTTAPATPHFATPEAAMNYLTTAWNADDLPSLNHVTNPAAREQLDAMHDVAVNLRLDHCDHNPAGDYTCYFDHDYPATDSGPEMPGGHAVFLVGPADRPGWYMTVLQSCS